MADEFGSHDLTELLPKELGTRPDYSQDWNTHHIAARLLNPKIRYNDFIKMHYEDRTVPQIVDELRKGPTHLAIRYLNGNGIRQTAISESFGGTDYPIGIDPITGNPYIERGTERLLINGDPYSIEFLRLHGKTVREAESINGWERLLEPLPGYV